MILLNTSLASGEPDGTVKESNSFGGLKFKLVEDTGYKPHVVPSNKKVQVDLRSTLFVLFEPSPDSGETDKPSAKWKAAQELLDVVNSLEKKYADLNRKLAEIEVHKAEATIERRKQEAIDNANLGDRSTNIKKIAELRTKELDIESDGVKTKAEMDTLDLAIKNLENKINHQSDIVAGHK